MHKQLPIPLQRLPAWFAASETPQKPLPWRALLRMALPLWLGTRALFLVETLLSQTLVRAQLRQSGWLIAHSDGPISLNSLVETWRLWDGRWYGYLVTVGYQPSQPASADFWPGYPLLAKPLEIVLGQPRWLEVLLITSNLATLAAFVLLGALAVQELETLGAAHRVMSLLAATPLALFLAGAYSDSLFLALVCAALLCARRSQWRAVALWAFLAALTRPTGVVLVAPLLWEYARQGGWRVDHWRLLGFVALAGAVPLAVAEFCMVCLAVYHDPLAWLHAQQRSMGHVLMWPWQAIGYAWQQFAGYAPGTLPQSRLLLDYAPLAFVAVFTLVSLRRIPASFSLLLAGILLLILVSPVVGADTPPQAFLSAGRYLLPAIPVYLTLAEACKRWPSLESLLVGGGFALQALCVAYLVTGGGLV